MSFAKPADFKFPQEKVLSLAEQQVGKRTTLERLNYIAIYLGTYLRASFHCSGVNSLQASSALVLREQTRIAVIGLIWTVTILSSSETNNHFKRQTPVLEPPCL